MKRLCFALLASCSLFAVEMQPGVDFSLQPDEHIVVNNRVLLKLNNKPLSVMDVVRKMDLIFYQQYPHLVNSAPMRFQFYQQSWETVLAAMIDDQLILADAKDKRIDASEGEVREALEKLFGHDPVLKLDELGVTYDEIFEMLKTDIIVQKLTGGMVHAKAATAVNPKKMRQLYERLRRENPPQEIYKYRVLSFRGEGAKELALQAHQKLEKGAAFEELPAQFVESEVQLSLSEEYERSSKEISKAHEAVLSQLKSGEISTPIMRKNVFYLFELKDMEKKEFASFNEMEGELKSQVMELEVIEYNRKYRMHLRKRYGLSEKHLSQLIPQDLKPFAMR